MVFPDWKEGERPPLKGPPRVKALAAHDAVPGQNLDPAGTGYGAIELQGPRAFVRVRECVCVCVSS